MKVERLYLPLQNRVDFRARQMGRHVVGPLLYPDRVLATNIHFEYVVRRKFSYFAAGPLKISTTCRNRY